MRKDTNWMTHMDVVCVHTLIAGSTKYQVIDNLRERAEERNGEGLNSLIQNITESTQKRSEYLIINTSDTIIITEQSLHTSL